MKAKIDIDTGTFVRFWLVLIGFTIALFAIYSARTALTLIAIAFFLAIALNVPVSYLAGHLPGKSRVLGTAIAYIIVVVALAAFVLVVVPPIVQQTAKFVTTIPQLADSATNEWSGVNKLVEQYHQQPQVDSAIASIQENAAGWTANAGRNVVQGAGSFLAFVASMFFVLVLSFLMLIEGPLWLQRFWGMYNDEARMERHRRLAYKMYRVVTGYVTGQLTVAAIGAVFSGIAVFVLSLFFAVPSSLAMTAVAITFTLTLVPMFGATIAGLLIALLLAFNDVTAGIAYAIYFVIYQQIENNFISPTIQARRLELSALAVLVAVTIGLYMFGVLGGLISIPIAGSVKVLLDDYFERARHERAESQRPIAKLTKKVQGES
jgi:predicted PurR-regulated permease PerM